MRSFFYLNHYFYPPPVPFLYQDKHIDYQLYIKLKMPIFFILLQFELHYFYVVKILFKNVIKKIKLLR